MGFSLAALMWNNSGTVSTNKPFRIVWTLKYSPLIEIISTQQAFLSAQQVTLHYRMCHQPVVFSIMKQKGLCIRVGQLVLKQICHMGSIIFRSGTGKHNF